MPRKKDLIATFLSFCPIVAQNPTLTLGVRRSNDVPENVRGFSPSHTATAINLAFTAIVCSYSFNYFQFSPQTSFRTLMSKLHLHRTILISFVSLALFHFHCIVYLVQFSSFGSNKFHTPSRCRSMDVSVMNTTTMNTTTITADVECFNGLRDLFM